VPKEQINELIAIPWPALAAQVADEANTAVNCALSDEWELDTGRVHKHILGVDVSYRVQLKFDVAEFTSSITSPPGYQTLSRTSVVLAAPLSGTWTAGVVSGFTARFRAWVGGTRVLSVSASVTQRLELYGMRATAKLKLNTSQPDRPRLSNFDASLRFGVRLRGLIDHTLVATAASVGFEQPDIYRIRIPLEVPVHHSPVPGLAGIGFEGFLVFTVNPQTPLVDVETSIGRLRVSTRIVSIAYDGALKFHLLRVRILGKKKTLSASVPFSFDTGARIPTPARAWDLLGLMDVPSIPRDWGENPPGLLRHLHLPPATFDFLTPALDIEESLLPQADVAAGEAAVAGHAPYGLVYEIEDPPCGSSIDPIYKGYQDTAIWTGHFLAAESFRYAVAPSPSALERVRFILGGIEKLFEVTGVSGLFARAALRGDSEIQTSPSMCELTAEPGTTCDPGEPERTYQGTVDGTPWCGYGRGDDPITRDSYIGVMLGMACAYKLVDDEELRSKIRRLVTAALNYLVVDHRWNVRTPDPQNPDGHQRILTSFAHEWVHQLALLRLGKTVNEGAFGAVYDHFADGADCAWLPIWGTTIEPIAKYYKFNLSHAAMLLLLLLEDDAKRRRHYLFAFRILRRAVRHHRNAHFNLVRVAVELPADREAALSEVSGFSAPADLRSETRALMRDWLTRLECVRGPRGLPLERPPDPRYLLNLLRENSINPAVEYTSLGEHDPRDQLVSTYALPVDKRPGSGMDFIWQRPPFDTDMCRCFGRGIVGAGEPNHEDPGVDYLLPFWMGAYLQVFQV